MLQQGRQTAYKAWISDLINNEYIQQKGEWEPNFVQIRNKQVSRVNIIAIAVEKFNNDDGSYASLNIDDGTETIPLKVWKEDIDIIEGIEVGDIILAIGRIKEYNGLRYILPEIVKKIENPRWVEVRKLELKKEYGEPSIVAEKPSTNISEETTSVEVKEEKQIDSIGIEIEEEQIGSTNKLAKGARQDILDIISRSTDEEGMDILELIETSGIDEESANSLIQELLKEGEIFEIKKGKVKIIE
jgi:RPA family protein